MNTQLQTELKETFEKLHQQIQNRIDELTKIICSQSHI